MRYLLAVGAVCGASFATSVFAADWQQIWQRSSGDLAVSMDKQSLKKMGGSKVRILIMEKYTGVQASKPGSSIPDFDTTIGDYVINCGDYSSTANRNTWYLNSKVVHVFNGPGQLPPPPQLATGIPAAFKAACS